MTDPDPRDTPALLDLLDEHQVKAVFFMIGEKVAAHPELALEVVRRGHEIGIAREVLAGLLAYHRKP